MPAQDGASDHRREATELGEMEHGARTQYLTHTDRNTSNASHLQVCSRKIENFWKLQVSATVPHNKCQDHFALERTFLGYLRTSLALAMLGVVVAQLFRLTNPKPAIRGYLIGVPLASILIAAAILVLLLGAFRSWRQQNAMLRSKVHAGGWEIMVLMLTVFIVSVILFALIFAIDSARDHWARIQWAIPFFIFGYMNEKHFPTRMLDQNS